MSVSVPWPGTTASLSRPSSCPAPHSVSVRTVNNAGLAGPASIFPITVTHPTTIIPASSTERPPWLLFQTTVSTLSSTSAISHTTTSLTSSASSVANETQSQQVNSSCLDGSRLCLWRPIDSQLCSVYLLDGHVLIVNRTETTIAVRLLSNFNISLRSGLILVRTTTDSYIVLTKYVSKISKWHV